MRRLNTCSTKILSTIKSRCSQFCSRDSQWIRITASKGYIAHTMLEMLNVLHKKPQQVDLNVEAQTYQPSALPSLRVHVDSLGSNQPVQHGTMPLIPRFYEHQVLKKLAVQTLTIKQISLKKTTWPLLSRIHLVYKVRQHTLEIFTVC